MPDAGGKIKIKTLGRNERDSNGRKKKTIQ